LKNAVTLKTGLGVRQGHWKCIHLFVSGSKAHKTAH